MRGRLACLEVRDEGPSRREDQLPRVFDCFWRASPDRGDGGAIQVTSAPGRGCRFLVELPLAGAARSGAGQACQVTSNN